MPQILPSDWLESAGLRTTGSLVNTSVYTTTLVFAGLLLLHYALNRKPGLVRTLFVSAFLLALFCIFLSFSRSSWLGGILVVLGLLFVYPKFTVKLSLIILFAVLLATTGRIWINEVLWAQERLQSREAEQSALSRLPVYYASVRMFEAKPLFGWGYGNFDYFDRQFQGRVVDIYSPIKDHASHNLYLTILAEQGVIGLSFFLIPLIWWYALSLRVLPNMPREGFWSKKLLVILWLVILKHIVVNNFFNMRVVFGLGMWWVTLGLIANLVYTHLSLTETAIERRRVSEFDRVAPL